MTNTMQKIKNTLAAMMLAVAFMVTVFDPFGAIGISDFTRRAHPEFDEQKGGEK